MTRMTLDREEAWMWWKTLPKYLYQPFWKQSCYLSGLTRSLTSLIALRSLNDIFGACQPLVLSTVSKYIFEHTQARVRTHMHVHTPTHPLVLNSFVENVNGSDPDFQPLSIPAFSVSDSWEEAWIFVPFTQWKTTCNLLFGVPFCLLISWDELCSTCLWWTRPLRFAETGLQHAFSRI